MAVARGSWAFGFRCPEDTLSEIGAVLLECLGNVLYLVVSVDLTVCRKLTQVDQLGQGCVRLVAARFVDLLLHLDLVAVI